MPVDVRWCTEKLDQLQIQLLEEKRLHEARVVTDAANLIDELAVALDRCREASSKKNEI